MLRKTQRILTAAPLAAALVVAAPAVLADPSGFTITPSIGYEEFDNDRNADLDDSFWSLGLGYRFASPWALELVYADSELSDVSVPTGAVAFTSWRLDGLYHLATNDFVTPYLAFGAGIADFESDLPGAAVSGFNDDATNVNLVGGLKFRVSDFFSVRTDVRGFRDLDEQHTDLALSLGLQFLLGGKAAPAAVAAAPVAAAPVAVDGDADGDGVTDSRDRCPGTPIGVEVDANGCQLDDDRDGVVNADDECPDTELGAKVDSVGCYIILEESRSIELKINFATNSSVIESQYFDEIEEVAVFMREYPKTKVVIEGHTDDRGQAAYNQQLSEKRANNVAATLVNRFGVAASRVSSIGYGEVRPIADNNTADGRAANRRVVAVISATVQKRAN